MEKENVMENNEMAMEKKEISIIKRILRGIARPFMHVGTELASIGVFGVIAAVAIAVVLAASLLMIAWAREVSGIAPNTIQDAILAVSVCCAGIYVFVKETNRAFSKLRAWTDRIHGWIAAA